MWLRTREIKPGVYETSSLGTHLAKHVGIVVAVPALLILVVLVFVGFLGALFSGQWEMALQCGCASLAIVALAYYHHWYYKRHPEERGAKRHRGPWDN